ncbi:MAG TPA: amidohydrolase family protein [Gemmatimonadales bacterium]|nr:amidohydrolase family protein [Gemmatimonadales bacterium]
MLRLTQPLLAAACLALPLTAQSPVTAPIRTVIHAGTLIDGIADEARSDQGILVENGRITAVGPWATIHAQAGTAAVVDWSAQTVLPGLIDAHTHVLLQGDITQLEWDDQLLRESIPYRAIRATAAARRALDQGFTSIRDVGTEGAMYADVDLKRAIQRGVVPGPRMSVATRAFAPTGKYPPNGFSWELPLPGGVQFADGVEEIRKAVREQVSHGADWIKVYVDGGYYLAEDGRLRSRTNYTDDELDAFVQEAHRLGRRVAGHAMGWDGIDMALRHGFDSIEHGVGFTPDLLDRAAKQGTAWCPTIHVVAYVAPGRGGIWQKMVELEAIAVREGVRRGVRITYGTDAGGYAWTEPETSDFGYLVRYGMTPMQAIRSATIVAATTLGQEHQVGSVQVGRFADLIATDRNPLDDIAELGDVRHVMKDGVVFR